MCIIIGNVHQFIGYCLIPLDPWVYRNRQGVKICIQKVYIHFRNCNAQSHWNSIMINKITPSVDYNLWLKCLDTQHTELTNQNSLIVPKVFEPMNKKMLY